jgi:hypothetical protein
MAHVTLPAGHAERDFDLAKAIARDLELVELHVFWPPRPERPKQSAPPSGLLARLAAVGAFMERLGERLLGRARSRPPDR